ncbi:hypothetical protein A2424_01865 [Candidatus Peribacteria bacterium RIFOXYC1_FULL_54_13]|nr:MAG: hypothetical protein A2424_01865 [Candidatus Peribacteria bacterium RIFOXYC1_FULL_54_13]
MTEFFFALVVLILKEWCKREEISEVGQAVLARATCSVLQYFLREGGDLSRNQERIDKRKEE